MAENASAGFAAASAALAAAFFLLLLLLSLLLLLLSLLLLLLSLLFFSPRKVQKQSPKWLQQWQTKITKWSNNGSTNDQNELPEASGDPPGPRWLPGGHVSAI